MKLTNLKIANLFSKNEKFTFLVGAGCSVDAPSCLPAGYAMMKALVNYSCAESEIESILEEIKLGNLRFEQLVEIIRDLLDNDLKIIDYYGLCDKPNVQHFFLAEMIKQGHFIMTTNFDFLIEYALQQSGIHDEDIIPVITKEEFEKFDDPYEQLKQGKKAIYKVHGSTKNIITEQDTKDSLVATIQAFGSNKEGESVFQLEAFKRPLFENITKNRSLVVMGYSGSDDFDIVPTLKVLENLQDIFWINYSQNIEMGKEEIYEINDDTIHSLENLEGNLRKIVQLLLEIWRMKNVQHIYLININTKNMVKELINFEPILSPDNFSVAPLEFIRENVKIESEVMKYMISYQIFINFDMYDNALRCAKNAIQISEKLGESHDWKSTILGNIAYVYLKQGNYPEALKVYEEALVNTNKLESKSQILSGIGVIYSEQGNYPEALKRHVEVLRIDEQLGDLKGKAIDHNNIGMVYKAQGNFIMALENIKEALKIVERLGEVKLKASYLNNLGTVYSKQGSYPEALENYKEALEVVNQLKDWDGKVTTLNNIGGVFRVQGKYPEALEWYEEALKITEQLGNLNLKSSILNNIADVYSNQGRYSNALKSYKESLMIDEQLKNWSGKVIRLNNIAFLYQSQKDYPEALKWYGETLRLVEYLGDLNMKNHILNNIGFLYDNQGNYSMALKQYEEAVKISEQIGDMEGKARALNNIAFIYQSQGNTASGLKLLEGAFKLLSQSKLEKSPLAMTIKKNIEIFQNKATESINEIKKKQEIIECHKKWNNNSIKKFLIAWCKKYFTLIREKMNWEKVETIIDESEFNVLKVSSGLEFEMIFRIGVDYTKKSFIQINWEEKNQNSKVVMESFVKEMKNVFGRPSSKFFK